MNPFELKPKSVGSAFKSWAALCPKPYSKNEVDPYTKTRIILMNGTEFEAVWFGHQYQRRCPDNDLRRELALLRRVEQQQQKIIAALRPLDETILETTISYEQLAVDLTAGMAQDEPNKEVKAALDFALLEDFDHLYRYADLLEMESGVRAEQLVGHYTEIMPGRPTVSEHRHPYDNVRRWIDCKKAHPLTKLHVSIITAAEQQTMNYYMNTSAICASDTQRRLFQEIGLIEEQHVTQYGSLMDTTATFLESLLQHEYTECYLYYSCFKDETDKDVKAIWEMHFEQEVSHLHKAAELLKRYEKKEWQEVIPVGDFPKLLTLHENKKYIRGILAGTVQNTSLREDYLDVASLDSGADFFRFQKKLNDPVEKVPTHSFIQHYMDEKGSDYRFEEKPHPVAALRSRTQDNTTAGRQPGGEECC
ncbi:MAG: hypothetical protein IIV90_01325 [Oscillospiraceae bacterium]|nr:hypothetical protein [Oscillospiraceae bacterium]